MNYQHLLTPYFLNEPLPELVIQAGAGWHQYEVDLPVGSKRQEQMTIIYRRLRDLSIRTLKNGSCLVSLAGDCCASMAIVAGLQKISLSPTLIWLDAHGDFNTWETTPSGFLGGMPLAMIVGRGEQTIMQGVGAEPLAESDVWLSDARDLDPAEAIALHKSSIHHIKRLESLLSTPLPKGPLHLHFDTDVIDPTFAPAMSYPVTGGVSPQILERLFHKLAESEQLVAVTISAWNPRLENSDRTAKVVLSLLDAFSG